MFIWSDMQFPFFREPDTQTCKNVKAQLDEQYPYMADFATNI